MIENIFIIIHNFEQLINFKFLEKLFLNLK